MGSLWAQATENLFEWQGGNRIIPNGKFLEKYNLRVISLEDNDNLTDSTINEVKKLVNNGTIKYIYSSKDETNDVCKNIINNYGIDLVTLNTMETIDGGITNSNENYITIMNNNLDLLNKELYK